MTDIEMTIKGLERFRSDFKPFCGNSSDWERIDNAIALLKNADLTALDLVATQIAKKANDDGRFFSPYEVGLMLTQHGQHDNRFKWGEVIKYSPSEVEKILKEAKQTDAGRIPDAEPSDAEADRGASGAAAAFPDD